MNVFKIKRMTLMFIVSIATAILAITSGYLQYRDKIESSEKALKKEQEINDKSNQIIALQSELLGLTTGGDSYAEIMIIPLPEKPTHAQIFLKHHGKFPLSDLTFRIVDLDLLDSLVKQRGSNRFTIDEQKLYSLDSPNPQSLLPNIIVPMGSTVDSFATLTQKSYNIFFNARNGLRYQLIRLFKKDKQWYTGTIIFDSNYKIIYESIDVNIPRELFTWDFKE